MAGRPAGSHSRLRPTGRSRSSNASEPVVTKEEAPTPAALTRAGSQPLGRLNFDLVSVLASYQADRTAGQKVEARGLIFRSNNDAAINLTSLQAVGAGCP